MEAPGTTLHIISVVQIKSGGSLTQQTYSPVLSHSPKPTVHSLPRPGFNGFGSLKSSSIERSKSLSKPSHISAVWQSGSAWSTKPSQSLSLLSKQLRLVGPVPGSILRRTIVRSSFYLFECYIDVVCNRDRSRTRMSHCRSCSRRLGGREGFDDLPVPWEFTQEFRSSPDFEIIEVKTRSNSTTYEGKRILCVDLCSGP